jgi:TolB-like protein/class 3 adenylate cyclase/Tfp pilus assembly protein PilF
MAKDSLSGKLAVILHADVVGSTALVHQDEQLAHDRIQSTFRRFGDTISKYHGRVRELRGDALLAEFERASDAVTAALAFQTDHTEYISRLNDNIRPTVRVGIAMGEVIIADDTITGAGVVLAQRLEQLAEPGGVIIQGAAYETIPGRFPFEFENQGEHKVKGFEEPIRVYSPSLRPDANIPQPGPLAHRTRNTIIAFASITAIVVGIALMWVKPWELREEPASLERMAFPLPSKPSIAVLAFDNLSGDPDQEYLSDGISEGIIRELSRFPQLFVIARNSSFTYKGHPVKIQQVSEELGVRYVVEGSLQSTGDQIRVTAQLIDATTGNHLWSNRYDGGRQDFFAVQDEITQIIVSTLAGRVELIERGRVLNNPAERLQAYEYVQQGWAKWYKYSREANDQAQELHEKALQLDPEFAEAYVGLTFVNLNKGYWSDELTAEESLKLAFNTARKAVQVDPFYYRSHLALANVYSSRGNLTQAMAEYDKALELNPNATKVLASAAEVLVKLGRAKEAVVQTKLAIRLNPYHPDWYLWNLGWAQYFAGDHEDALTSIRRMHKPPHAVNRTLAVILARLGQLEEARLIGAEFLTAQPNYSYEKFIKNQHLKDAAYQDKLTEDLRKAGLYGNRL